MLQPGETAKYRHVANRDLVTVTRFAARQLWEDAASKMEANPITKEREYDHIRVSPSDCEIKPAYGPAFLFPFLALECAYEREPEAA